MSGMMAAMAGGLTGTPPSPFSAGISIGGGASGVTVTTDSGTTREIPGGGERFFSANPSGGTPPYSYLWQRQNGENLTALESTTSQRAYVTWTGMTTPGYLSTTARCRVRDATGATVYTDVHVIGITRA